MNLAQLHYFRKLAQLEHYTQAAQELFISQPSLSASIAAMEDELHIKLFQKKGRNVRLTKDGKEFYAYVCRALDTLQEGIDTAWERSGLLSGQMDLACSPSLLMDFLPELIAAYQAQSRTKMRFQFHSIRSVQEIASGIADNQYDAGFSTDPAPTPLLSLPLCTQKLSAFVCQGHPLETKQNLCLSDLAPYPLLTCQGNTSTGHTIHNILKQAGLSVVQTFDDEMTIYGYLSHNHDLIAIAPDSPALRHGLTALPVAGLPQNLLSVYLIYSKENHISKAARQFLSFVQEGFSTSKIA